MIATSRIHPEALEDPAPLLAPADVDRLADEIAEVASLIDAAEHRLLTLIRRFDEGSGWATHGALSCAHWLNWRIGLDLGAARERVRVARALAALPLVDDALRRGAISYSKVRAITRVASAATEATLLEMATHATASQLERICRGYRRVVAADVARPESLADEESSRFVRVRDTDDGMVRIEARLRPEEAAVVLQALDVARRRAWGTRTAHPADSSGATISAETSPPARSAGHGKQHEPPPALSRADALVAVAESWLSSVATGDDGHAAAGLPVELVVHVDHAALVAAGDGADDRHTPDADDRRDGHAPDATELAPHASLADGTPLALATARRLACDASVVLTSDDADDARDVGGEGLPSRRTRRISPRLRRALRLRDDGCRFPGCTNRLTDAHHVISWIDGGATTLANLLSLCRRHHRFVHEHGYRIVSGSAGEPPRFFRRDGRPVPLADEPVRTPISTRLESDAPASGALPDAHADVLTVLRAAHAARGVAIDAATAFPRWDGTPLDAHLAVQALLTATRGDAAHDW
ncbi:HNH endonuclease [Candidatus Binatia bacterium]|nr:HNH endonuclease [Candidatus Binatia bacterium]